VTSKVHQPQYPGVNAADHTANAKPNSLSPTCRDFACRLTREGVLEDSEILPHEKSHSMSYS
jgi:hypothetical protein